MTAKAVKLDDEYHVASFVAQITPNHEQQIKALLNETPGAEIHAISDTGKVVFTIEASEQWIIGNHIDAIKSNAGFLTLAPVYHEYTKE